MIRWKISKTFVLSAILLTVGCRDRFEAEAFNTNLGDGSRPLLPTPISDMDESVLNQRADVIEPLADLGPHDEDADHDDDHGGDDRAEIIELIASINDAMSESDFETVADHHVERQRSVLRDTADLQRQAHETALKLIESLKALDPQPAYAAMIVPALEMGLHLTIAPEAITFESETKASAPLAMAAVGFEKVDGRWYMATPTVPETTEQQTKMLTTVVDSLQGISDVLADDSINATERDAKVFALFQKFGADMLAAGSTN